MRSIVHRVPHCTVTVLTMQSILAMAGKLLRHLWGGP